MKKKMIFPALRAGLPNKVMMNKRYTFASSPVPTNRNNLSTFLSSTPILARLSHSPLNLNTSPINQNTIYNRTPISYSPPEDFQSPIAGHSQNVRENTSKKKRPKLPKVKTFHPKRRSKSNTKNTIDTKTYHRRTSGKSQTPKLTVSPDGIGSDHGITYPEEVPLPKRRNFDEKLEKKKKIIHKGSEPLLAEHGFMVKKFPSIGLEKMIFPALRASLRNRKPTNKVIKMNKSSPLNLNTSPINQNTTYNRTPISYSPPEDFQSRHPPSPIPGPSQKVRENPPKKTIKKRPKLPKVKIFHPVVTSKKKKTIDTKTYHRKISGKTIAPKVTVSPDEISDPDLIECEEVSLPKRRKVEDKLEKKKKKEKIIPKEYKSMRVEGGSMVEFKVLYKSDKAIWKRSEDVLYSIGTTTEQFKWGFLEIVARGIKSTCFCKDWMIFHLLSGSVNIFLDSFCIGKLDSIGDTFVVPPGSAYELRNEYTESCFLAYSIIILY